LSFLFFCFPPLPAGKKRAADSLTAAGGSAASDNTGKARVPGSVFRRKGSVLAD